jgi:hypothetical protein
MAHFAELNEHNYVTRVVAVNNDVITTESNWSLWQWKQTSYNNNFRKNYAGIGYRYDQTRDAFIAPKPYTSWVLDDDTCRWEAPTPHPDDDKQYSWDEDTTSWKEI